MSTFTSFFLSDTYYNGVKASLKSYLYFHSPIGDLKVEEVPGYIKSAVGDGPVQEWATNM